MTDNLEISVVSSDALDGSKSGNTTEMSCDRLEVPDAETTHYLESFNIDTGTDGDDGDAPHYIINLNAYNSDELSSSMDTGIDSLTTVPVTCPQPSTSDTQGGSRGMHFSEHTPSPSTGSGSMPPRPYLKPMSRVKCGRGRGRPTTVPLDDMMESKIRTFEGRDCVQHLDQLQRLFPRFKRAYINRIFTKNFLNYDKTFQELNAENEKYIEKYANVRLVHGSKQSDSKRETKGGNRSEPTPLNPLGLMYLDMPLSRCPPHIASTLYRRVIVKPDGSVESADELERKYLDSNGLPGMRSQPHKPPKPPVSALRPFPASPLQGINLPLPDPMVPLGEERNTPMMKQADTKTPQSGNRFFRTNRVCETEIKKRGYVDRELRSSLKSTSSNRRSRQSAPAKSETDNGDTSDSKEDDAAVYMASVGVVSTPISRKRKPKPKDSINKAPIIPEPDDGLNLTNEERTQVLEFFNEALPEELALMSGCSQKTAQILISLRPFDNTTHLLSRLSNTRFLSPNLIDSCKEVLQMRLTVVRLLQRCECIAEKVTTTAGRLLTNAVAMSDGAVQNPNVSPGATRESDESSYLLTQQPAILNPLRELKPYQLVGLNWLRLLHREKVNGILADEMGLGKTIQAIAFLASLWENGDRGPHLIICPSSTQDNWQRELADWCPHLKVFVYQGAVEQRKAMRLKIYESGANLDFNILLTSYVMGTSTIEDRVLMKRMNFHYGIFDEAHMLKNMLSQRYKHLANFRVQRRLLLTGTPLQNNLMELVSLLAFVMPDVFARSTDLLKRMFPLYSKVVMNDNKSVTEEQGCLQNSKFEADRLEQAKNLLKPFCLRRLKSQVLNQLPPKTTEVIRVPMTLSQSQCYWNLVNRFRQNTKNQCTENGIKREGDTDVNAELLADENTEPNDEPLLKKQRSSEDKAVNGTKHNNSSTTSLESSSNMLVQLRKAANHQALLTGIAYNEEQLKDIADSLHLDASHANSDVKLIFEDLKVLSDHQVHKICQYYDILSSYALPIDNITNGSGKIAWLNENIPKLVASKHRLLIFSQFVIVLDLLEEFLRSKNWRYVRLDGSTPVDERQQLIDRFNSSSIEIFLLSTRAGGMGINLTGADIVIIHDIDFNPYNDKQAEDRVHRLGQTKPVHIIRLVSEGTVEEGILRLASEKLQLEENVTGAATIHTFDEMDPSGSTVGIADMVPGREEFSEPDITHQILGSSRFTLNKSNSQSEASTLVRSNRLTERELSSLLEEALKANPE